MGSDQENMSRETVEQLDLGDRSHDKQFIAVDNHICSGDGSRVSSSFPSGNSLHRRLARGLGRSLAMSVSAYKLVRTLDSADSSTAPTVQATKQANFVPDRPSTAVSYLKKQGRTTRILKLVHDLDIQILPRHRTSKHASRSRGQIVLSEWALSPQAFQWAVSQSPWGPPQVDLFADTMTHRLPRCFSPCPDREAIAVGALRSGWPNKVLYAFLRPACYFSFYNVATKRRT